MDLILGILFFFIFIWVSWKIVCYCFRILVRIAREEWSSEDKKDEKKVEKL